MQQIQPQVICLHGRGACAACTAGRRIAKAAVASGLLYAFWITAVLLRHMPALNDAAARLAR